MRLGQSFAYPTTFAQADAEIKRLKSAKPTPAADRSRESRQIRRDFAERRGGSAADELRRSAATGRAPLGVRRSTDRPARDVSTECGGVPGPDRPTNQEDKDHARHRKDLHS